MPSSGMLCHVVLVRTDILGEHSASIVRVTRIGKLGTMLAVTTNQRTLQRNTRAILCNIPDDEALHLKRNFIKNK
jgi:hypothetical protein